MSTEFSPFGVDVSPAEREYLTNLLQARRESDVQHAQMMERERQRERIAEARRGESDGEYAERLREKLDFLHPIPLSPEAVVKLWREVKALVLEQQDDWESEEYH